MPYLLMDSNVKKSFWSGAKNFLTFFVLFNTFVPISLYVTIEFVKLIQVLFSWCPPVMIGSVAYCSKIQSYFMAQDLDLYDEQTDQPVVVKTTALLEDLGQVRLHLSFCSNPFLNLASRWIMCFPTRQARSQRIRWCLRNVPFVVACMPPIEERRQMGRLPVPCSTNLIPSV